MPAYVRGTVPGVSGVCRDHTVNNGAFVYAILHVGALALSISGCQLLARLPIRAGHDGALIVVRLGPGTFLCRLSAVGRQRY